MRIELEGITVEVPRRRLLDSVTVELVSSAVTAIIGPSGAGKSTLLRVIAGLATPDAGQVRFDGEVATRLAPERRRVGLVFQDLRLFDFLSARDNVGFAPRLARVSAAERQRRVDDALAQLQATAFADRPARVLSGGERQRVAIARALAAQPQALLLDEPFAALDTALRRGVREELGAVMRALGLTVALVTHDREDAFALAARLIVLRDGRVEQQGEPVELYLRPANRYVATLLGEASFVPAERVAADAVLIGGLRLPSTGTGRHALLRPEQLELTTAQAGWPGAVLEARFFGDAWRTVVDAGPLGRLIVRGRSPAAETIGVRPLGAVHTLA
jgi:ABC-type sulfate/molybdate transport systems ATPase subunit